jgi:hypothetical protein
VEGVSRFFEMLYTLKVRSEGEDKMCWIPARKKSFQVKSYYKVLSSPIHSSFPWKSIWKVTVPPESGILCVDGNFRENLNFG